MAELCLICCKCPSPKQNVLKNSFGEQLGTNTVNGIVRDQLKIIFLLRHILEIPEELCCNFLQNFGDPKSWYAVCTPCEGFVEKARRLFDEMVLLKQEYEALQNQIKNAIVLSANSEITDIETEQKCGVRELVRSYVSKLPVNNNKCFFGDQKTTDQNFNDDETEDSISSPLSPTNSGFIDDRDFENESRLKDEAPGYREDNGNYMGNENTTKRNEASYYEEDDENYGRTQQHESYKDASDEDWNVHASRDNQKMKNRKSKLNSEILHKKTMDTRAKNKSQRLIYNEEKPFKCEICCRAFTASSNLARHIKEHNEEKPFKCETCGKYFRRKNGLKDHLISHSGEKPYVCHICEKACSFVTDLRKHIKRMHPNAEKLEKSLQQTYKDPGINKPRTKEKIIYNCDVCQKPFNNYNKMKRHVLSHSGLKIRPFQCDICGKSYTKKDHLKDHQMIHTGEKPFVCDICGNCFPSSRNLNKHLRTHSGEKPFECETCGKAFKWVSNLRVHQRVHTGEKPYKCKICDKSFVKADFLKSHENSHTGEKPSFCEICGKSFYGPHYLRKHKKRVHEKQLPKSNEPFLSS